MSLDLDKIQHVGADGFIDYNDSTTSGSPISIAKNTWTTITNDGAGAFSNSKYNPEGVFDLMNVSIGAIDVSHLQLGDSILIRNDFTVTPNTNNSLLKFRYQLGAGGGSYTLEKIVGRLDSGSGQPYRFSLTSDLIYMGDLNTRDNPISLQVHLSGKGSLVNSGTVITVIRR